jgi:hypothetical protein
VGATTVGDLAASTDPTGGASPSTAVADDNVAVGESGGILGHPIRAPGDVSLDKAMGTAHWALTQAQDVLHKESGGINDERWRLLLWASMLKERTTIEKARVEARRQHLDMREELLNRLQTAINRHDRNTQKMLADAKVLYASAEARANNTIK